MSTSTADDIKQTQQKIQKFVSFLNNRLYPDLQRVNQRIDELNKQKQTYENLYDTLVSLNKQIQYQYNNNIETLDILSNIGHDIYGHAVIDTTHNKHTIIMNIGCDLFIDMTIDDGIIHCSKRVDACNNLIKRCNVLASSIKTQTKTVYSAINELTHLTEQQQQDSYNKRNKR